MAFRFTLLFGLALFISNCSITNVRYQASYPPEINLPEGQSRIKIITWHDTTTLNPEKNKRDRVEIESFKRFELQLMNALNEVEAIRLTSDSIWTTSIGRKEAQPLLLVQSIFNNRDVGPDFIILIESFKTYRSREVSILDSEKTVDFKMGITIVVSLFARNGVKIDQATFSKSEVVDSDEVNSFFEGLISIRPGARNYGELFNQLATDLAIRYARKFKPTSTYVTRIAYSGKMFESIPSLLDSGKYKEAEEILVPLTQNRKKSISKKATYNMYILKEASGNIPESRMWLKKYEELSQY